MGCQRREIAPKATVNKLAYVAPTSNEPMPSPQGGAAEKATALAGSLAAVSRRRDREAELHCPETHLKGWKAPKAARD